MIRRGCITAGAGALALAFTAGSAAQPARSSPLTVAPVETVVVELFTAQGCGSCPEADRTVEALAGAPNVIALTYGVDYWDYQGWADTFAKPEFVERQRAYQQALRLRGVYTPQIVVDGRRAVSGVDAGAVGAAVEAAAGHRDFPPEIEFRQTGAHVGIGSGRVPEGGAEVWAVIYQPGPQTVEVGAGDNRGRELRQVNVVKGLQPLGTWRGRATLFPLPETGPDTAVAVLVQSRADGRILAAAAR